MNLLAVFVGGGLGSLARYGLGILFNNLSANTFPFGTLAANTISSLIIGILMGIGLTGKETTDSVWKTFLAVGFCGGFSTFSAFSLETMELAKNGMMTQAILNVAANVVLCLAATAVGVWLAKGN